MTRFTFTPNSELYAVVQFAVPGFLGSLKEFKERFADPIIAQQETGNSKTADELRERLQKILIRRYVTAVLSALFFIRKNYYVRIRDDAFISSAALGTRSCE